MISNHDEETVNMEAHWVPTNVLYRTVVFTAFPQNFSVVRSNVTWR